MQKAYTQTLCSDGSNNQETTIVIQIEATNFKDCASCCRRLGRKGTEEKNESKLEKKQSSKLSQNPSREEPIKRDSAKRVESIKPQPSRQSPARDPSRHETKREDLGQSSQHSRMVLPILPKRHHGLGCVMELDVMEKHDNTCLYKKADNEYRNDLDDRVGSYDCIGRLVFRTCDKSQSGEKSEPIVFQQYDGARLEMIPNEPDRHKPNPNTLNKKKNRNGRR